MNEPSRRAGRPPLTERRKAATRLEIAREAVRLFAERGVAATSAEEIAAAAGISVRTLWRYFPTKESCVQPLLTAGIETTARLLRTWPPGEEPPALFDDVQEVAGDAPAMLHLVRQARTEPGLRAVWLQAHGDAEPAFAKALGARAGEPSDSLRIKVQAAMVNGALRAAVEHYAWQAVPSDGDYKGLVEAIRTALRTAAQGLSG